jgi:hypothetical protein
MANDLIVQPGVPATRPRRSVPALVFGSRPVTIARRTTLMLIAAGILYFGVIGNLMHRIDADLDFSRPVPVEGGSAAINAAAGLIEREVRTYRWSVNDPSFYPTAFHDNMPNFQRGVGRAVGRFVMEFESQIGRMRGSSAIDRDLERAVGFMQYPPDVWVLDFRQSLLPVQTSGSQYLATLDALDAYNARVATGTAPFETRADALAITVQRLAADLGARAAEVDAHVRADRGLIDFAADDLFYVNKGMIYAYYHMLRGLGTDFDTLIRAQGLTGVWEQALGSLQLASQLRPLVVLNAAGDESFFANHLHLQGFYLKRAILQLDEIARVMMVGR